MKNKLRDYDKYFIPAAVALFILSCFLHLYDLGELPGGFFIDESAIGYNAWCIAENGTDEYGTAYPMFFRCFNNYHDPVTVYLLVPFVKVFGLSKTLVRLPGVVFHLLASASFFFLSWQLCRKKWLSLIAAFFFSVLPWIFPLSRLTMSGYTPMLFGICTGLFFLLRGLEKKSYPYMLLAAAGLTFGMYSHNCARPTIAAFMIMFVLAYNICLLKRWKLFTTFFCASVLIMIPMGLAILDQDQALTSRFNEIAVWRDNPGLAEVMLRIGQRYLDYFNPYFIFVRGDINSRHNPVCVGLMFYFSAPLVLVGLYRLLRYCRHNPFYRFIVLGLAVYPVAAILTVGRMHATRSLNGSVFWCLVALYGAEYLIQRRKKFKVILLIISVAAVLETAIYMHGYFFRNRDYAASEMGKAFVDSLEYAHGVSKQNEKLYISPSVFSPYKIKKGFKPYSYSPILFCLRIPPEEYIVNQGIPKARAELWNGAPVKKCLLLLADPVIIYRNGRLEKIKNPERIPPGAKLLGTFKTSSGNALYLIRVE